MSKEQRHFESGAASPVDVSVVMHCLDDRRSLESCVGAAFEALARLHDLHGFSGEVVVADSGSADGSRALARKLGARVVEVTDRGYGSAIRAGMSVARGRYLVLGGADGAYDFREAAPMVEALTTGAGLCMGSRFKGEIRPGAMPWINRWLGNPILSWILNVLFAVKVSDVRCELRALTRACFDRLGLNGSGMEFASEMVVKAALRGEIIAEVPVTAFPGNRARSSPLEAVRDGWRHLRYLFMLSPSWLFAGPAVIGAVFALTILGKAGWAELHHALQLSRFGNYWVILASAALGLSHLAAILAIAGHLYGVREGYRKPGALAVFLTRRVSLETMLLAGALFFSAGLAVLFAVTMSWTQRRFASNYSVYWPVIGALLMTLGAQNSLGGFLLAIIGGNQAHFLEPPVAAHALRGRSSRAGTGQRRGVHGVASLAAQHSFVVLAYKDSPFLRQCLQSIYSQSLPSSVSIATSTPSSYIEAEAKKFGVTVLVNPRRTGIAGDWNFALQATNSRYVTLAHQDDLYFPQFLERSLELFDRSVEGTLCFTGYEEVDDVGAPKSSKISKTKHLIQLMSVGAKERVKGWRLRAILSFGNTLPCSTVTYDRQRLGPFTFSDKLASNLDWEAWWRLQRRGEVFLHTHERLVGRRHNALTATSELIRDGRRRQEDIMMFRQLWPGPVGDAIAYLYRAGY